METTGLPHINNLAMCPGLPRAEDPLNQDP